MTYTIVSFDGGGIRGLIPALLLKRLQSDVQEKTNQNFLANVSMFAGTSTGSLLALSMARDPSAHNVDHVVGFYEDGAHIFTPFKQETLLPLPPALAAFENTPRLTGESSSPERWWDIWDDWEIIKKYWDELMYVRYDNAVLRTSLQHNLGDSTTIGDLHPDILVNTLQLWDDKLSMWLPIELTKATAPTMTLVDAALCSSAAPTYFPPFLPPSNPTLGYCVDGGTFANNPSVTAITSALAAGKTDIALLSFGTGRSPEGMKTISDPTRMGMLAWFFPDAAPPRPAMPLLAAMMSASSELVDRQANQLLHRSALHAPLCYRLNPKLSKPIALDGTTHDDMQEMKTAVDKLIRSDKWSEIVDWVAATFQPITLEQ